MNLYATTTSERASKGQGGNKELVVNLKIDPERRMEIGNIVMKHEDGIYTVYYYPINENCTDQELNSNRILLYETKGKRQKGDYYRLTTCIDCKQRIETHTKTPMEYIKCPSCGKEQ